MKCWWLISWSRNPLLYKTKDLLWCSEKSDTELYTESNESSPCPHSIFLRSIMMLSSYLYLSTSSGLLPFCSPTETSYAFIIFPRVLNVPPISNKKVLYLLQLHLPQDRTGELFSSDGQLYHSVKEAPYQNTKFWVVTEKKNDPVTTSWGIDMLRMNYKW